MRILARISARTSAGRFGLARWLCRALGVRRPIKRRTKVIVAVALFAASFSIKSLYAVDLEPVMYTSIEPGRGMAADYDRRAASMADGHGILFPDDQDPTDASLIIHPPGYYMFLAAVYRLFGRSYF